jgi:hypothetical protein
MKYFFKLFILIRQVWKLPVPMEEQLYNKHTAIIPPRHRSAPDKLLSMYRLPSLAALAALLPFFLNAQRNGEPGEVNDFVFARNHFSVAIVGGMAVKAAITADPYKYKLGSSNQVAFGGGINYHQNFSRKLSLITGLHMIAPVRNMEYYISKDEFSPPMPYDLFHNKGISQTVVFLLRVPLILERRWFYGNNNYTYASAGVSLNYTPLQEEEEVHIAVDVNNQPRRYFYMLLQPNNNNKPWLNYHIGGGHAWMLKNKNFISAGIIANLSFTRFINGNFTMEVPGQPVVNGHYSFKGSYAGLTVCYIYTGVKKRLRKMNPVKSSRLDTKI